MVTLSQFLLVFQHTQEVFSLFGGWCYISLATYKIKLSELVLIPLLVITGMQPNRLSKSPRHSWLRLEWKKCMERAGILCCEGNSVTGTSPGRACSPPGQWETFWILHVLGTRSCFSFHCVLNYIWGLYWQQRLINNLQASLRSSIPQSISPVLLSSHSCSLGECFFFIHFSEQVRKFITLITGSKCR